MTATALIIDDEPDIRELLAMTLSRMGLDFHTAANLEEARHLLQAYHFDVCLTDMRLPDGNGVEFVRYIQSTNPTLPVAVITAHGNMQAAVDAMKNGAYDFVSKPVDIQQLRQLVVRAVSLNNANGNSTDAANDAVANADIATPEEPEPQAQAPATTQTETLAQADTDTAADAHESTLQSLSHRQQQQRKHIQPVSSQRLIGISEAMDQLRLMIAKVARSNAPVWITGESGTGKELIAKLVHENGPRCEQAFVAINCGAIPSELMESELFGHVKGSFTGAVSDNPGLFRQANGGTLFLDEVAELPAHMQVKLLRAIQERTVRPVGGTSEEAVDVRVLSASHKDLGVEVEAGRFRHDLYYRLNVISLKAPALRERAEDIPALADFILAELERSSGQQQIPRPSSEAMQQLCKYSFPGNVRELENLLERAVALCENDCIELDDLQLPDNSKASQPIKPDMHNNDERTRLIQVLESTRWNRKAAAEKLGLTYRQLRYRIQQLGINADD